MEHQPSEALTESSGAFEHQRQMLNESELGTARIAPSDYSKGTRRALRKSCDRCYSQKLKCFSNIHGTALFARCNRCERAGLKCTYSARSARQANTSKQTSSEAAVQDRNPRRLGLYGTISPPATDCNEEITVRTPLGRGTEPGRRDLANFYSDMKELSDDTDFYAAIPDDGIWQSSELEDWNLLDAFQQEASGSSGVSLAPFPTPDSETLPGESGIPPSTRIPALFAIQPGESALDQLPSSQLHIDSTSSSSLALPCQNPGKFHDGTNSMEAKLVEHLACLSKHLELLQSGQWAKIPESLEELYSYPVGEVLQGGRRLLAILKENENDILPKGAPHRSVATAPGRYGGPAKSTSSQITVTFLVLNSYILAVKIMAHVCQDLCTCLPKVVSCSPTIQGSRSTPIGTKAPTDGFMAINNTDRDDSANLMSLGVPWSGPYDLHISSKLRLGEVEFSPSPLSRSLRCIYGTMTAGLEILKGIENVMHIPPHLSVEYDECVLPMTSSLATPKYGDAIRGSSLPRYRHHLSSHEALAQDLCVFQQEGRSTPVTISHQHQSYSLSSRLVTLLWEEEEAMKMEAIGLSSHNSSPGKQSSIATHSYSDSTSEIALTALRRCNREVKELVKSHIGLWMDYSGL